MNKERIDDLVDILGEEYARIENTFVIRNQEQLVKYLEDPKKWKAQQLASRTAYKKELIANAKEQLEHLNEKAEKVFLLSYKEVDKDAIEVSETEIVAEDLPTDVKKQISDIKKFNAKEVLRLANQSLKTYTKQVRLIDTLSTPDDLYEVVKRQLPKGIENGIKIAYKDGKQFSWKAYMEMNIRTTVHQEMNQHQTKVGAKVGQIFYICDSFGDCAPDHADYQGKIYYNADAEITDEAQAYIDANGIQSIQEVRDGEPYLGNFHAIPTSEVLSETADEILEKNDFKYGEYEKSNYEALQKQRYNERQIRKFKLREENARKIIKETGVKDFANVNKEHQKVLEWQRKQRELIKENEGVLERQYNRENAKIVVNDLGVRYDYKVQEGELVKKK